MAYFANGCEGDSFDDQCSRCKYGEEPCPIYHVQMFYNYDASHEKVATSILNDLVKNNGMCMMFKTFQNDFEIKE